MGRLMQTDSETKSTADVNVIGTAQIETGTVTTPTPPSASSEILIMSSAPAPASPAAAEAEAGAEAASAGTSSPRPQSSRSPIVSQSPTARIDIVIETTTPTPSTQPTATATALKSHGADVVEAPPLSTSTQPSVTATATATVTATAMASHGANAPPPLDGSSKEGGDEGCPCLLASEYFAERHDSDYEENVDADADADNAPTTGTGKKKFQTTYSEDELAAFEELIGPSIDPGRYGFGCSPHDADALQCSDARDCVVAADAAKATALPPPSAAICDDKSYCRRSWCWVDPRNCSRLNNPSDLFASRHYSYATCGELDSFTHTARLRSLRGRTFQVGYASNTGGWKGAYNPSGTGSFAADKNVRWTGPMVEFVREAALEGGFVVNATRPPEWLRPKSREFFGDSDFDLCVYAVSLGYLDFCVGGFSINMARSSVTTMFETTSDPVYLVTHDATAAAAGTDWESFLEATVTVFQPFTASAWFMIFVFCLPGLGLLMFFHEYGEPGSAFPTKEPVLLVENGDGGGGGGGGDGEEQTSTTTTQVVNRTIPGWKNVSNAIYMGTLSFFHGSYDQSVVSVGGKIHLLAIAAFIMLIIAVYTANLAAILTQDANKASVDSVQMAVKQGMNICAVRKVAEILIDSFNVPPDRIVPDPIDLGGDGKPGFNCPECKSRERIFDNMRPSHDDPTLYCNVAVAAQQDLDILHRYGNHCDKTRVGDSIAFRASGIPIYDKHADALVSLLHKKKADGVMTRNLAAAAPESQCPETGGEGTALTIQQLTGVWVITFAFALLGLLARLVLRRHLCCRSSQVANNRVRRRVLRRYDQWGNSPPNEAVVDGYKYNAEDNEVSVCDVDELAPLSRQDGLRIEMEKRSCILY